MRREQLYLADIVEACDAIQRYMAGVDHDAFLSDDMLQSAVLQKLTIIGEAASRLSDDFCERYPEVDWPGIVGFRNIAVHAYFSIEWPIVWIAATRDAPELRSVIGAILSNEYPR
jgi:uncharacterized protein with HEPN domain